MVGSVLLIVTIFLILVQKTHIRHLFIAKMRSFQLNLNSPSQNGHTVFKYLGVDFVEFIFHHVEVLDGEGEYLTLILALYGELSFECLFVNDPII